MSIIVVVVVVVVLVLVLLVLLLLVVVVVIFMVSVIVTPRVRRGESYNQRRELQPMTITRTLVCLVGCLLVVVCWLVVGCRWLFVGWLLVVCWLFVGCLLVSCWLVVGWLVVGWFWFVWCGFHLFVGCCWLFCRRCLVSILSLFFLDGKTVEGITNKTAVLSTEKIKHHLVDCVCCYSIGLLLMFCSWAVFEYFHRLQQQRTQ